MNSPNRSTIEARASHRFQIPAQKVFDAWLDPAKVRAWMASALKGFGLSGEMRRVEIAPQVGGKFCFSDLRGGMEAVHRGTYLELVRPSRIAFTWIVGESDPADEVADAPSKVTLTIEPDGTGCMATLVHEMDLKWAEYVSRTEQSWTRMLQAIESLADPLMPGN
ncbi:MAG: SRPBCC domain-containing protein [Planctomycetota bacterium]